MVASSLTHSVFWGIFLKLQFVCFNLLHRSTASFPNRNRNRAKKKIKNRLFLSSCHSPSKNSTDYMRNVHLIFFSVALLFGKIPGILEIFTLWHHKLHFHYSSNDLKSHMTSSLTSAKGALWLDEGGDGLFLSYRSNLIECNNHLLTNKSKFLQAFMKLWPFVKWLHSVEKAANHNCTLLKWQMHFIKNCHWNTAT